MTKSVCDIGGRQLEPELRLLSGLVAGDQL